MTEPQGDVVRTREDLRRAAMTAVGGMQAVAGFLRDRDDLSREHIEGVLDDVWRKLNAVAEATPSFDPTGSERWPR